MSDEGQPREVRIVDVRVPFWSMVVFMVKWALASIPALFILMLLVYLAGFFVAVLPG